MKKRKKINSERQGRNHLLEGVYLSPLPLLWLNTVLISQNPLGHCPLHTRKQLSSCNCCLSSTWTYKIKLSQMPRGKAGKSHKVGKSCFILGLLQKDFGAGRSSLDSTSLLCQVRNQFRGGRKRQREEIKTFDLLLITPRFECAPKGMCCESPLLHETRSTARPLVQLANHKLPL